MQETMAMQLTLRFDGSYTAGAGGAGAVLFSPETDKVVWQGARFLERCPSSAAAEYEGLILGLEASVPEISQMMAQGAFERGLVIETAGAEDEVIKLLPPLVVTNEAIDRALEILNEIADDFDEKMVEDLRTEREASEAVKDQETQK